MKQLGILALIGLSIFLKISNVFGQTNSYDRNIKLAEQFYQQKSFLKAAVSYSKAFESNKDRGRIDHRYTAAQCWAMAGKLDSAFYQLERISKSGNYISYYKTSKDEKLKSLHVDVRWNKFLDIVKINKEKKFPKLNEALVAELDTIMQDDQKYRNQITSVQETYGWDSENMKALVKMMSETDVLNTIRIKSILDVYGWLGSDVIGEVGNNTLFLVIQHADQNTQEKYLPMLREAVKDGKAQASSLAFLEDRVAIRKGKKQVYGTQIRQNDKTKQYYVLPLEDPEHVDQRRSEVKLPPISDYVKQWNIVWSVEQYESDIIKNK